MRSKSGKSVEGFSVGLPEKQPEGCFVGYSSKGGTMYIVSIVCIAVIAVLAIFAFANMVDVASMLGTKSRKLGRKRPLSMMDEWSTQTDEVFFSTDHAGEKIRDAIIHTPLTIDDIPASQRQGGD